MQVQTDTCHLERARARIESLDLDPIKFKISSREDGYGWTGEHTDRIEIAYRRFLVLLAKYPKLPIAPTRDIDAFWHAHILDTRKYAADCEGIFGRFVRHDPCFRLFGDEDRAEQSANALYALFVVEFGEEVPNNARTPAAGWRTGELPMNKTAASCAVEPPTKETELRAGNGAEVVH